MHQPSYSVHAINPSVSYHATAANANVPPLPPYLPARVHDWSGDFFAAGNMERAQYLEDDRMQPAIINEETNATEADEGEYPFYCGQGSCDLYFSTLGAFDLHYHSMHTHRCEVCGLQLPNNRLLEMHIAERHDELFRVMAKTRRMYACLVEGCSHKSNTRKGRQLHLVAKHAYPPAYTYDRKLVARTLRRHSRE